MSPNKWYEPASIKIRYHYHSHRPAMGIGIKWNQGIFFTNKPTCLTCYGIYKSVSAQQISQSMPITVCSASMDSSVDVLWSLLRVQTTHSRKIGFSWNTFIRYQLLGMCGCSNGTITIWKIQLHCIKCMQPELYKSRSVQNTGTCYPGKGWFVRNLGWGR